MIDGVGLDTQDHQQMQQASVNNFPSHHQQFVKNVSLLHRQMRNNSVGAAR